MILKEANPGALEILRMRRNDLMGKIHQLTRRRDMGEITLDGSLEEEISLVIELGQVQDRLRALGEHSYDGCPNCNRISNPSIHERKAGTP